LTHGSLALGEGMGLQPAEINILGILNGIQNGTGI